jgi:hypothetical protein
MAEMAATGADGRELVWTDGVFSGEAEAVRWANIIVRDWETVEIIPLPELPIDDDSSEVVGYVLRRALEFASKIGGCTYTRAEGMKSRTAHWGDYDASGRVY